MTETTKVAQISDAIDRVKAAAGLSSDNRLAGALDVTRQALSMWRQTGRVPAARACQMEVLSHGRVTWRELAPEIIEELRS